MNQGSGLDECVVDRDYHGVVLGHPTQGGRQTGERPGARGFVWPGLITLTLPTEDHDPVGDLGHGRRDTFEEGGP